MDRIDICNSALSRLGADLITDIDEDSRNAQLCKANYSHLRQTLQQTGLFAFALKRTVYEHPLSPAEGVDDWGYLYAFSIPKGEKVLYISQDSCYNDTHDWDQIGVQLHCNLNPVQVTSTRDTDKTSEFSYDFQEVLIARLASVICIPITQSRLLMNDLVALYEAQLKEVIGRDNRMKQRSKHNHHPSQLLSARLRG